LTGPNFTLHTPYHHTTRVVNFGSVLLNLGVRSIMPPYQLLLAEALVGATLLSSFALFLARSQQQKIHLPTVQDASLAEDLDQDPFNVTKPDDLIDGEPIDEDAFWVKVSVLLAVRVIRSRVSTSSDAQ
jgi:hypothetical protein